MTPQVLFTMTWNIRSYYSDENDKVQRISNLKIIFDEDALMHVFYLGMIFKFVH